MQRAAHGNRGTACGGASPGSALAPRPAHMGDDSTWQCRQAWLQYSPMLSCRMAAGPRTSGLQPAACRSRQQGAGWELENVAHVPKTTGKAKAQRRFPGCRVAHMACNP